MQYRCHKLRWFQHKQLLEENDLGSTGVYRFEQHLLAFGHMVTRIERVPGHKATRNLLAARLVALGSLRCEPFVRDITGQVQHAAEVVLQSTGQAHPPPADRTVSVLQRPDNMSCNRLATHEAVHGVSLGFAWESSGGSRKDDKYCPSKSYSQAQGMQIRPHPSGPSALFSPRTMCTTARVPHMKHFIR